MAVKELKLAQDSYVVFGSCPLAAVGIREANDIDLYVTPEVLKAFAQEGWHQIKKAPGDEPYVNGIYEAHANWDFSPYAPSLQHLLQDAMTIDGVSFASLDEVKKWKVASGGLKHDADVKRINEYMRGLSHGTI